MEPLHDWRSPQFEEHLGRLDRGGVSFEFLRRNREYRQDYADTLARVASGGAGTMKDFADAFTDGKADAALAASLFHFQEITIPDLKHYLRDRGISVRL